MSHRADARPSDTRDTDVPRPTVAPLPAPSATFSARLSPARAPFAALSRPYYCCWDGWIFLACRLSDSSLCPRTVESHPRPVGGWIPFPYHRSATIDSPELFASVPTIKRRHHQVPVSCCCTKLYSREMINNYFKLGVAGQTKLILNFQTGDVLENYICLRFLF